MHFGVSFLRGCAAGLESARVCIRSHETLRRLADVLLNLSKHGNMMNHLIPRSSALALGDGRAPTFRLLQYSHPAGWDTASPSSARKASLGYLISFLGPQLSRRLGITKDTWRSMGSFK